MSNSRLRAWRTETSLTLSAIAGRFGVSISTASRWETGEILPDADVIDGIVALTSGAVSAVDMHRTRLMWLRGNRPDRFQQAK